MNVKNFCLISVFAFFASSCSSDSVSLYSCDKNIDAWVKNNLSEIQKMTRLDFISMDNYELQRGVYNALKDYQKRDIWQSKFEQLIMFELTEREKEHIRSLIQIINENPNWFLSEKKSFDVRDQIDICAYRWIDYAEKILGWSFETIFAVVGTPNEVYQTNGNVELVMPTFIPVTIKTRTEYFLCNCHDGSYGDFCGSGNDCIAGDCVAEFQGCGWLWSQTCNGMCYKKN